jgi:1-acyl-sn-glycerol-3-phosphate acyltransferase
MIGWGRTVLALAVVAVMTAVLAPAQWFCVRTGACRGRPLLKLWHRTVARLLGFRIHVHGAVSGHRPLMLVANHVSWADIIVLAAVADVSFIAKSEMAGWPLFGWFSRMQRSVYVERDAKRKSGEQASEIATRLGQGDVMVLFAEGTTGDGTMLLPFKTTLFGAASMMLAAGTHEEMWIQPAALAYTRVQGLPMGRRHRGLVSWIGDQDLVPHLAAVLREGAIDVEVHFGEPVRFASSSSRKDVARQMEEQVRAMLEQALWNPSPR